MVSSDGDDSRQPTLSRLRGNLAHMRSGVAREATTAEDRPFEGEDD